MQNHLLHQICWKNPNIIVLLPLWSNSDNEFLLLFDKELCQSIYFLVSRIGTQMLVDLELHLLRGVLNNIIMHVLQSTACYYPWESMLINGLLFFPVMFPHTSVWTNRLHTWPLAVILVHVMVVLVVELGHWISQSSSYWVIK